MIDRFSDIYSCNLKRSSEMWCLISILMNCNPVSLSVYCHYFLLKYFSEIYLTQGYCILNTIFNGELDENPEVIIKDKTFIIPDYKSRSMIASDNVEKENSLVCLHSCFVNSDKLDEYYRIFYLLFPA